MPETAADSARPVTLRHLFGKTAGYNVPGYAGQRSRYQVGGTFVQNMRPQVGPSELARTAQAMIAAERGDVTLPLC